MAQGRGDHHKRAAKAAKRKAAVAARQQAERRASSLSGRVAVAAASPVARAVRTADMFEAGIGHVIIARRLPSGALGCAFFLVDLLCLGAKDAFYRELAPSDFEAHLGRMAEGGHPPVELDPAAACKLVTGAVAFAAEFGIAPDKDYRAATRIFGDIDPTSSPETFVFGQDGRPVFVPGPSDTPARMREVHRALQRHDGTDGSDGNSNAEANLAFVKKFATAFKLRLEDLLVKDATSGQIIEHEGPKGLVQDA